MKHKQGIKCSVFDCVHCNCEDKVCNLNEVEIKNCEGYGAEETTMCHSYDIKKK